MADSNDELSIHPGPRDRSVLHLQATHRSDVVWDVGGGDSQRARRRNPNSNRFPPLHPRMIPLLTEVRFDGVARLTGITIDWSLITALVERWRPETHTFHLPTGECTITLQDVTVLLGLRIDGAVVTGCTEVGRGWGNLIQNIFGEKPKKRQLIGGRLQLSWLTKVFPSLPDDASEEQLIRYTQSYMLQLIAGILFTDHSGGQIHCMYIPLIQDLATSQTLAWGAAVLAYLYRELCKSCRIGTEEIAGCILLLQLWAWVRLPTLAPVCHAPTLAPIWGDHRGPYGLRFCARMSFSDTGAHVVSAYRLVLDVLAPSHFIWQPYSDELLATLPDHCRDGSTFWRYRGPLICFYIVEPHQPDRCLRQFGMIQDIPVNALYSSDLHLINLKGKTDIDWRTMHHDHILIWDSREQHVILGDVGVTVADEYDRWYTNITRRFHTRIGGALSYTLELLDHVSSIARGVIHGEMKDIDVIATQGRRLISDQFSHGVCQDFPVEDRREKEILLKAKKIRVGHKGGRGGVNAPRRRGILVDEVLLEGGDRAGDDGGDRVIDRVDHVFDEGDHVQPLHDPTVSSADDIRLSADVNSSQSHQPPLHEQPEIDLTPALSHPRFNLLTQSTQSPVEQPGIDPTPSLSHPTFNLLTKSPQPSPEPVDQPVQQENMQLQGRGSIMWH